jgi:hypothetical protein
MSARRESKISFLCAKKVVTTHRQNRALILAFDTIELRQIACRLAGDFGRLFYSP